MALNLLPENKTKLKQIISDFNLVKLTFVLLNWSFIPQTKNVLKRRIKPEYFHNITATGQFVILKCTGWSKSDSQIIDNAI